MLTKNIYILYPAGYGGSYIHWCISKSEKDSASSTIDDPLNTTPSTKYGGVGTAHLHVRIPTHQNIHHHKHWMIYNRPEGKRIYLVNTFNNAPSNPEQAIADILRFDPDPVFIVITNGGVSDIQKFGAINTLLKWPVFFKANQHLERKFGFDSFDCNFSREARNLFVEKFHLIFPQIYGLHTDSLTTKIEWYKQWFNTRNSMNGHEVNDGLYPLPVDSVPKIHTLTLKEAMSLDFIPWFENFCNEINAGEFDSNFVSDFHPQYVQAQDTLQWFDEIENFRKTFQLTPFLKSHSLIQAFVILEVLSKLPVGYDWQNKELEEIVNDATQHTA